MINVFHGPGSLTQRFQFVEFAEFISSFWLWLFICFYLVPVWSTRLSLRLTECVTSCFTLIVFCLLCIMFGFASPVSSVRLVSAVLYLWPVRSSSSLCTYCLHFSHGTVLPSSLWSLVWQRCEFRYSCCFVFHFTLIKPACVSQSSIWVPPLPVTQPCV